MSQDEVITWLEAHPGWHKTKVIVDALLPHDSGKNGGRISDSLRRAHKAHQIKRLMGKDRRARWSA